MTDVPCLEYPQDNYQGCPGNGQTMLHAELPLMSD